MEAVRVKRILGNQPEAVAAGAKASSLGESHEFGK